MHNLVKKIFIADDNVDIVGIMQIMLKNHGYDVVASNKPSEIIASAQAEMPDLILLDLWIAGEDGRDICSLLKNNHSTKDIPVIFVSADSNIEAISKENLADGFIAKPFEMGHLLNTIASCLS